MIFLFIVLFMSHSEKQSLLSIAFSHCTVTQYGVVIVLSLIPKGCFDFKVACKAMHCIIVLIVIVIHY